MKTARIQYNPVTLTTNSGLALLKDGVEKAARELCYSIDPLDPDGTCVRNAIESALPQISGRCRRCAGEGSTLTRLGDQACLLPCGLPTRKPVVSDCRARHNTVHCW